MKKWSRREYWPLWFFYIPVFLYWLWLGIKARSLVFFTASNPLMTLGGLAHYSKYKVLQKIPSLYVPKTILIPAGILWEDTLLSIQQSGISFPLIIKPDRGERGFGVKKIDDAQALKAYHQANGQVDLIVQAYLSQEDYPIELGVMYHRMPGQSDGKITSIVSKEFLTVEGDGVSSLKELLERSFRASLQVERLSKEYDLTLVLPKGQKKIMEPIGNHIRGTKFVNANHLIHDSLCKVFDKIALPIEGFYFGRFDLKVPSLRHLQEGKDIQIMELNGANSEPAHIYDPEMPLLTAYTYLFQHWSVLYSISKANKGQGVKYMPFWEALHTFRKGFKQRNSSHKDAL